MEEIPSQPEKQTLYLSMADTSAGNAQMLGIVVPRTGGSPQTQIVSSDNSYTGTISWNPGDSTFQPAATYQAAVTLYAGAVSYTHLTVVPSSSTGSNTAIGLIRPVLEGLHSISLKVVSRISSAHLKAKAFLGNFDVEPRESP